MSALILELPSLQLAEDRRIRRTVGHSTASVDPARFIGTREWQRRKRYLADKAGKEYSQEREIKRIYRHLDLWHDLVDRVNASAETETGKELSPAMVNYLDLEFAVKALPSRDQREAWNACIIGRIRRYDRERKQEYYEQIGRVSYSEAARLLDIPGEMAVRQLIKRATAFLLVFLYEPEGQHEANVSL